MTVLIKLFYAGALAALLVLSIAFGIRTLYSAPEEPQWPQPPIARPLDPGSEALREYEEAQQQYQVAYEEFEHDRAEYRRNVFFVALILALVCVAGGVSLAAHLDALRLGLVAGGLAVLVYAVIQAGGDLGEVGSGGVFVVALIGLALVLGAGYRWLQTAGEGRT